MIWPNIMTFSCLVLPFVSVGIASGQTGRIFTNSVGMHMVRIEAGSFIMGQAKGGDYDERPVHRVNISTPFYMASKEVTNAQYEMFDKSHRKYRGIRGVSSGDDEAVVYVSWHDAVAYCRWLSAREGKTYRLPTEAEWEYACRAGTKTAFFTGENLPAKYYKNQPKNGSELRRVKGNVKLNLKSGQSPANAWGLYDMHGNVEEWCHDWYGSYPNKAQTDPVGRADGLFKITRGGSHSTFVRYLRSANRSGAHPDDKHWLIGFRVVLGELPKTKPLPAEPLTLDDSTVNTHKKSWSVGAKMSEAFFAEPLVFVIPLDKSNPLARLRHHHCPTITWCPNGDLLAAWYATKSEIGREMVILSSRLRDGADKWDQARLFYKAPDRNMTGSALFCDKKGRLYFFNGISESTHHKDQCMVMATSLDSGRSWTKPKIISSLDARHKYTPMSSVFTASDGSIVLAVDYTPLGDKANEVGSGVFISSDDGRTWVDKISGKGRPVVAPGKTDGLAAGFHISVVQLQNGSLMALTRKGNINGHVTKSISHDMGDSWTYYETHFPGIGSGQRSVLMRLNEGPILYVGFTGGKGMIFVDSQGREYKGYGMYSAVSYDQGQHWPHRKLLTTGGQARRMDGGGNTHKFTMDYTHAEPAGYLAATQSPDNVIHLVSSRLHYRFNLAWLKTAAKGGSAEKRKY